jgi:hypothetical protein
LSSDLADSLELKNQQNLRWHMKRTTSENIKKHYETLQQALLDLGFALKNPDLNAVVCWDAAGPDAKETHLIILIMVFLLAVTLLRIFNCNETEAMADMSGHCRLKQFGRGHNEKTLAAKNQRDSRDFSQTRDSTGHQRLSASVQWVLAQALCCLQLEAKNGEVMSHP